MPWPTERDAELFAVATEDSIGADLAGVVWHHRAHPTCSEASFSSSKWCCGTTFSRTRNWSSFFILVTSVAVQYGDTNLNS